MRGRHRAVELHVAAQVEFVGDEVEIFQRVGLRREMFLPVPFLQQLLRKRIAVGPAFGIEARAGIAVPVPGAADIAAGLEYPRRHAELAQAIKHEHAGNPGADDDRVVFGDVIQTQAVPPSSMRRACCPFLTVRPIVHRAAGVQFCKNRTSFMFAASPRPDRGCGSGRTSSSPCRGCRHGRRRPRPSSIRARRSRRYPC